MAGSATLDDDVLVDSLVTDVIDDLRALPGEFGTRPYRVFAVRRLWDGSEIHDGTYEDTEVELVPTPRVSYLDRGKITYSLPPVGIEERGDITVDEISLTYTEAELRPLDLSGSEEFFYVLREKYGQLSEDRYFVVANPPAVDREENMCWVVVLKKAHIVLQ